MNIIIGAMGIVGVLIIIMSLSSFVVLPLQIILQNIHIRKVPSIIGLFLFGILLVVPGAIHESSVGSVDKKFSAVTDQIFDRLTSAESVKALTTAKSYGSIALQSSSSLILQTSPASNISYKTTVNPLRLPIKVTGSFSPGYQTWCFAATDGRRESVYDQYGIAISNLATHTSITNPQTGYCLKGRAYTQDGSIEP